MSYKCVKCGADVADNANFCPVCGTQKINFPTSCTRCGAALNTANYCPVCGTPAMGAATSFKKTSNGKTPLVIVICVLAVALLATLGFVVFGNSGAVVDPQNSVTPAVTNNSNNDTNGGTAAPNKPEEPSVQEAAPLGEGELWLKLTGVYVTADGSQFVFFSDDGHSSTLLFGICNSGGAIGGFVSDFRALSATEYEVDVHHPGYSNEMVGDVPDSDSTHVINISKIDDGIVGVTNTWVSSKNADFYYKGADMLALS